MLGDGVLGFYRSRFQESTLFVKGTETFFGCISLIREDKWAESRSRRNAAKFGLSGVEEVRQLGKPPGLGDNQI